MKSSTKYCLLQRSADQITWSNIRLQRRQIYSRFRIANNPHWAIISSDNNDHAFGRSVPSIAPIINTSIGAEVALPRDGCLSAWLCRVHSPFQSTHTRQFRLKIMTVKLIQLLDRESKVQVFQIKYSTLIRLATQGSPMSFIVQTQHAKFVQDLILSLASLSKGDNVLSKATS